MPANIVTDAKRARARKHASRRHTCTCGRVCLGNGGWSSHKRSCLTYKEARSQKESQ